MNIKVLNYSFILLLFAFISCKKDKPLEIVEKYVIQGKILEDTINWRINTTTVQPVSAAAGRMMNFTENEDIVKSYFGYSHINPQNTIRTVSVFSPAFDINDSLSKKKTFFTLGKKDFTNDSLSEYTGFKVDVLYKGKLYTTSLGGQENKSFEITEVEYTTAEIGYDKEKIARTSITINCSLYVLEKNYAGEIKNLVMDADFRLEKE